MSAHWVGAHAGGRRQPVIPSVRVGGAMRFRREAIMQFIRQMERGAAENMPTDAPALNDLDGEAAISFIYGVSTCGCTVESARMPLPSPSAQPVQAQQVAPAAPVVVAPATVYVSFSAEIIPNTTEALISVLAQQANNRVACVHLLLSTPGGQVMNGMNLYNVLRGFPFELITHNVGNVDSIGNAVFLAGSKRYACQHSTFMFHGVGFNSVPNERLEQKNLQEKLQSLLSDQKRIGSIIQERTTIPEAEIEDLFREARTKDSAYALGNGIVHEIREVMIPPGGPIISLVFQR
jgi:ATP-dependent Clp protease, protease subunit